MITIGFSEADVNALQEERFLHPHPRVQVRWETVYWKSQQLSHQDICRRTRLSGNTLRAHLRTYQAARGAPITEKEVNHWFDQ
jgi:hypothetical protein